MLKTHLWIIRFVVAIFLAIATPAFADSVKLAWDPSPDPNVNGYVVSFGTSPGTYTFNNTVGNVTTYTVDGLTAGQTYYFAVKALSANGTESGYSNEVSSTMAQASAPADITSPAPNSTFGGSSANFAWSTGTGVTGYRLAVGTTQGGSDLQNLDAGTARSATVSGLPTDGRAIYVRLSSLIGTAWQYRDYRYTAFTAATQPPPPPPASTPAQLTSPAPGSTLSGSSVTFGWSVATGATSYWLKVGTTAGGKDIYSAGQGTKVSATVGNIPTDGRTIYVTLTWSGSTSGTTSASYKAKSSTTTPTPTPTSGTYSFWNTSTAVGGMEVDARAVELGMKFKSDVAGTVTGIRFYKYSKNTGTHVGSIWSASGQLLGQVTFSGETASGWQTATFTTPIAITAGTTYVVSYHTNVGYYAQTYGGLTNGAAAGPLHALAGSSTPNGVYAYRSTPGFPNQSYQSSNYWVDVVIKN